MAIIKRKKPQMPTGKTTTPTTSSAPTTPAAPAAGKPAIPRPAAPKPEPVAPPTKTAVPRAGAPKALVEPVREPDHPSVPRPALPQASRKAKKAIEPKDRANFKASDDYWALFDGRGKTDDDPVPLDIFAAHFPPVHGDGRDIPNDVWVQNRYGIIYQYVSLGGKSRTNLVRSGMKPRLDMNYREDER